MVRLFGRRRATEPYRHVRERPTKPGAWLLTLRSVPRHYHALKEAIESTGDARVWFGEELTYIRGKGVCTLRVEATGFTWLDALYRRWAELERADAFTFDVDLYLHDTQWVASLRDRSPRAIAEIIQAHAPTYQPAATSNA
ncbi:MAG: hypothetical protein QJR03_14230 [Sphaerobacter sp.]|nr:hypothetical protein [Sphaerobacter sp.]